LNAQKTVSREQLIMWTKKNSGCESRVNVTDNCLGYDEYVHGM